MGIDISKLSPAAQAQIARKLGQQMLEKERRNKFNAQPDTRGDIRFDSRAEARRYDELMLMLKAGKIRDLRLQPQFTLQEAYTTPDGNRIKATRYQADFSYERHNEDTPWLLEWERVVEDVKSKATKTRVYAIKKKLMLERFGIEITEVE
jgi:hypothetical protein